MNCRRSRPLTRSSLRRNRRVEVLILPALVRPRSGRPTRRRDPARP